jgi:hypothetical protein
VVPEFNDNEKDLRSALDAWHESVKSQADRPEWFWARQRTRILSNIREPRGFSSKFAWAGLAAVVAVAISLFAPVEKPKQLPPQPVAQNPISDHDLMLAIERSMNSGVPSSLAPASLLADEMNQAYQQQSRAQKGKEKHYEN